VRMTPVNAMGLLINEAQEEWDRSQLEFELAKTEAILFSKIRKEDIGVED
jgi:hypothetical protein